MKYFNLKISFLITFFLTISTISQTTKIVGTYSNSFDRITPVGNEFYLSENSGPGTISKVNLTDNPSSVNATIVLNFIWGSKNMIVENNILYFSQFPLRIINKFDLNSNNTSITEFVNAFSTNYNIGDLKKIENDIYFCDLDMNFENGVLGGQIAKVNLTDNSITPILENIKPLTMAKQGKNLYVGVYELITNINKIVYKIIKINVDQNPIEPVEIGSGDLFHDLSEITIYNNNLIYSSKSKIYSINLDTEGSYTPIELNLTLPDIDTQDIKSICVVDDTLVVLQSSQISKFNFSDVLSLKSENKEQSYTYFSINKQTKELQVVSDKLFLNSIISIYNVNGQELMKYNLKDGSSIFKTSIKNLPPAIYFLKFRNKQNIISRKFLVE
jgi:hypothetical protein